MAKVDGAYDVVTKTPMGDQQSVLTVISDEKGGFHGTNAGMMGSMDVKNGKVDGKALSWTMEMIVPMPMTLEATATVEGDAITGTVQAGAFGAMAMTGKRRG
jgi:hypothetical protein